MNYLNFIFCLILCFPPIVFSFSWQSCGGDEYPMKITALAINSVGNQTLFVTGKAKVAKSITFPLKAKLEMYKKFFWTWTEIPCVEKIGSCEYEDICTLSPYLDRTCPREFISNKLPCKCPIDEGQYTVKKFPIYLTLLPKWLESGQYKFKIMLSHKQENLLCLLLGITI